VRFFVLKLSTTVQAGQNVVDFSMSVSSVLRKALNVTVESTSVYVIKILFVRSVEFR
jgi:hypothetical protein